MLLTQRKYKCNQLSSIWPHLWLSEQVNPHCGLIPSSMMILALPRPSVQSHLTSYLFMVPMNIGDWRLGKWPGTLTLQRDLTRYMTTSVSALNCYKHMTVKVYSRFREGEQVVRLAWLADNHTENTGMVPILSDPIIRYHLYRMI
jgi:hypothetical protein